VTVRHGGGDGDYGGEAAMEIAAMLASMNGVATSRARACSMTTAYACLRVSTQVAGWRSAQSLLAKHGQPDLRHLDHLYAAAMRKSVRLTSHAKKGASRPTRFRWTWQVI
jgi:hypothetical protein